MIRSGIGLCRLRKDFSASVLGQVKTLFHDKANPEPGGDQITADFAKTLIDAEGLGTTR